ncbi:endonuclease domain-containing protein [bacterium]|nr:endonuclease domain-containing protein [bacterium]
MTPNGKLKVDCLKNTADATSYTTGSSTKVKFDCDVCQHAFSTTLKDVSGSTGRWCGMCSSNWKHCSKDDCDYCYQRSFGSYIGVTPNGKRKVDCLVYKKDKYEPKASNKKVEFKCDVCSHTFCKRLSNVTSHIWCNMCSSNWWKHCRKDEDEDEDKCDYCYQRSFASYLGKTPNGKRKVDCLVYKKDKYEPKGSKQKVKFKCDVCSHTFCSALRDVTSSKECWCGMCSSIWKHCRKDDCDYCYQRSFASYIGVTPNGKRKVDCLVYKKDKYEPKGSTQKVEFKCDVCSHTFCTTLDSVTSRRGRWCGKCTHKTELKVLNFLDKELGIKTKTQYTIPDIKKIYKIQHRFDLLLVKYNLIFEIDGRQHNARAWFDKNDHALFCRQIKDKWKEFIARKRGFRVVRFDQESIWADSYDWRAEMKDIIKDAKQVK